MFGVCKNGKTVSIIDLYLINDIDCFISQCDHIKDCFSSKIKTSKTGLLIKQEKGDMKICLFTYDGPQTIPAICNKPYIL